jgi:hypothetical protein
MKLRLTRFITSSASIIGVQISYKVWFRGYFVSQRSGLYPTYILSPSCCIRYDFYGCYSYIAFPSQELLGLVFLNVYTSVYYVPLLVRIGWLCSNDTLVCTEESKISYQFVRPWIMVLIETLQVSAVLPVRFDSS